MKFFVVTACRAASQFIEQCLDTVGHQIHRDWLHCVIVDDVAGCPEAADTYKKAKERAAQDNRVIALCSDFRRYALHNQLDVIDRFCPHDAIVVKLDGDDFLVDPGVLTALDRDYTKDPELDILWTNFLDIRKGGARPGHTCRAYKDGEDPVSGPWVASHLQTFRKQLLWAVPRYVFKDPDTGEYWRCTCDQALFKPLFCHARKYAYQHRVSCGYRRGVSDNKTEEQRKTATRITAQVLKYRESIGKPKNVVFFVNGPGTNPDSRFNMGERRPPLGILSMAAHLRARHHKVTLVDRFMDSTWWPRPYILDNADVVGVYCSSPCRHDAEHIVKTIRKDGFKCRILAGGPHAILRADEVSGWGVDSISLGEADWQISEMVEHDGGQPYPGERRIRNLDELPFPAYDLLAEQELLGRYATKWPFSSLTHVYPLNTSRGCPHECAFCDVRTVWGRNWVGQSWERMVLDVEYLVRRFGARGVYFREDNFACNRGRLEQFCTAMTAREPKIPWACELRADIGSDESVVLMMARAGCKGFYVGAESGSDRLLGVMKKGITADQIVATCQHARVNGIVTAVSMIDGYPGETDADRVATAEMLNRARPGKIWRARYRTPWAEEFR